MKASIACLPGDGIGPETCAEATRLLDLVHGGATVLVKGSRSLELENLVAAIEERFAEATAGTTRHADTARAGAGR